MDTDRLAVCSWSLKPTDCDDLIRKVRACGLSRIQLHLDPLAERVAGWEDTPSKLRKEGIGVVSGMVTCVGEDYSTIETIEATGGVMPDKTWPATLARMQACARAAEALNVDLVTFHAGFIPAEPRDATRAKVVARVQELSELMASHGAGIALETGQESAATLDGFLAEVGRGVGVNFDAANMLLYGSGDPVEALKALLPRVRQVHLKDAIASGRAGEWGEEVPLGKGEVASEVLTGMLLSTRFTGDLVVEREAGDDRVGDVRAAVDFVGRL